MRVVAAAFGFLLSACALITGADFDHDRLAENVTGEPVDGETPKAEAGPESAQDTPSTSGPKKCGGTAMSCTAIASDQTACFAQAGCQWSAPKCSLTTPCSSFTTSTSCQAAPGCGTDFTTSTCKPIAGYCVGATASACEATSVCQWSGGCLGAPAACTSIAEEAACVGQSGCSWR